MSYYTSDSLPAQDDSPWMSGDESMAVDSGAGPSQQGPGAAQSAVSQQEWDKLSLKFSDVSIPLFYSHPVDLAKTPSPSAE